MPSQQRFEGSSLEDLLAEVNDRFGPDANIVEANRIRTGGIGGFFAKEGFEVIVETDDASTPTWDDHGSEELAPAQRLLDLADAVDDGPDPFAAAGSAGTQTLTRSTPAATRREDEPLASESSIQRLLSMTDDAPLPDPPGHAGEPPAEGIAALLAKVEQQRARAHAPITPDGPSVSTDGEAFADVLSRITSAAAQTPTADDDTDAPFRSYAQQAAEAKTVAPAPPAPALATSAAPTLAAAPAVSPEVATTPHTAVSTPPVRGRRERHSAPAEPTSSVRERQALELLGIPSDLLTQPLSALDRLSALTEIASTFPLADPLPTTGNGIIALVGDRQGMDRAVTWVYDFLGLKREQMAIASRRDSASPTRVNRLTDAQSADRFRKAWVRRSQPSLVAIEHPVGVSDAGDWALGLLDALQPSAVWGVVSASRKPEDVVEWSARLRGVDAIVLDGTEDTTSPAAIVRTGLPVSLIDGLQATPTRWASVLEARLEAA